MRKVSGVSGNVIPCCWTECDLPGDTLYQAVEHQPGRNLIFLFCSERHKLLWTNSIHSMGNLPLGSRGAFGPSGPIC